MDAIYILRQLIEKAILFLFFVDLKQAFNRMHLGDVLSSMQEHNICEKYMKIVSK